MRWPIPSPVFVVTHSYCRLLVARVHNSLDFVEMAAHEYVLGQSMDVDVNPAHRLDYRFQSTPLLDDHQSLSLVPFLDHRAAQDFHGKDAPNHCETR